MRIIAGSLGGRNFDAPGTFKTHPMSDRVRGALFNVLGDIEDLSVLDAFGGSGALSFEALSRGAKSALIIESDKAAQKTITANIEALGVDEQAKLIRATTNAWLTTNQDDQFDLVLCDPPYNDLQLALIKRLSERALPEGLLVLSWPGANNMPKLPDMELVAHKNYGDAQLAFYRKIS